MRRLKAEIASHLILKIFDCGRKKLDHFSTMRTDHMIVVLMVVMVLVIGPVVAESDFARETCLGK